MGLFILKKKLENLDLWINAKRKDIIFEGCDNAILRGMKVTHHKSVVSKKAVLVVNGRGENLDQYNELYFDIACATGADVYSYDHRGQGYSSRLVLEDRFRGHVESYDDYVEDLDRFYKNFIMSGGYDEFYIVAHSMGGAVSVLWACENEDKIDGLFLSAPMFELKSPIPDFIARPALATLSAFGFSKSYIIGSPGKPSIGPFKSNKLTKCKVRYELMCKNNRYDDGAISLVRPTNKWALASYKASDKIKQNIHKLKNVKGIIFQAGEEQYIRNDAHIELSPKHWDVMSFPNDYHQLFHAPENTRAVILDRIIESMI
jgi:lysophospholipase